jgi:hypothetical protein
MVRAIIVLGLTLLSAVAMAAPGRVVVVQGTAAVTHTTGGMQDLYVGDLIEEGDVIEAGEDSYIRLMMNDGSVLDLGANTRLVIRQYSGNRPGRKVSLKLWVGRLWARVMAVAGDEDKYVMSGANAVVGIRGTEIILDARTDGSADVTVLHGRISLTSLVGDAVDEIGAMERGTVGADGGIVKVRLTESDVGELRKKGKPAPKLDKRGAKGRLKGVRERLQIEITPTPEPLELPEEVVDDDDSLDDLDRFDDDPADPLLDLDPDAIGEPTTHVRGDVEVLP